MIKGINKVIYRMKRNCSQRVKLQRPGMFNSGEKNLSITIDATKLHYLNNVQLDGMTTITHDGTTFTLHENDKIVTINRDGTTLKLVQRQYC